MPGGALRGEVCPLLLCQRHLPAVLLRVLLGQHPLEGRPRVSQATGEGGGRPPSTRVLPMELSGGSRVSPAPGEHPPTPYSLQPLEDLLHTSYPTGRDSAATPHHAPLPPPPPPPPQLHLLHPAPHKHLMRKKKKGYRQTHGTVFIPHGSELIV